MSKNHASPSQCTVFHDIECMTDKDLEREYDIEIYEDGVVYDCLEDREFESLVEWANFVAAQYEEDNYGDVAKIGGRSRWDDGGFQ